MPSKKGRNCDPMLLYAALSRRTIVRYAIAWWGVACDCIYLQCGQHHLRRDIHRSWHEYVWHPADVLFFWPVGSNARNCDPFPPSVQLIFDVTLDDGIEFLAPNGRNCDPFPPSVQLIFDVTLDDGIELMAPAALPHSLNHKPRRLSDIYVCV